MDKAWMTHNKRSNEYIEGLKKFMLFVANNNGHDCEIRCPCKKCLNTTLLNQSVVYMHLRQNGIDTDYTRWIFHGEAPIFQEPGSNESHIESDDPNDEKLDGVDEFLNYYGNFIGFNSELNPNSQSGEVDDFENMLNEAKQELYPGCTKFSKLSLTVKLLHLKVYNKWSNKSFDMLLDLLKECLPDGNTLPRSHYESKAMLRSLGLGYINIHACKYDCVLFWKELEKHESCPVCGTSRWKIKRGKGKSPRLAMGFITR